MPSSELECASIVLVHIYGWLCRGLTLVEDLGKTIEPLSRFNLHKDV